MTDSYETLKPYLRDYLHLQGINPNRRFHCLNPEHTDRNPSMGFDAKRNKVHCFSCGADYDIFDLVKVQENLTTPGKAFSRVQSLFGHPQNAERQRKMTKESSYIDNCATHYAETDYFFLRGLSTETIRKFSLGYDPKYRCVVLPCEQGKYVRRSVNEKKYLNEKGQTSPLFQPELLLGEEPAFLVEGTFDALSAEELGFHACGLNGSGNREKAAALLRTRKRPGQILLIPDNDAAGESWANALCEEFPWLYRCAPLETVKDLNELLCNDRKKAQQYLEASVEAAKIAAPPPYEKNNAASKIDGLRNYIAIQAERPALRTGFPALDVALDGGLYDGLYVLGAVSSLGKTAFCMQIADQLAMQGRDVLIASLEMSIYELMARSISRETFQDDETKGKRLAKTVRGILNGRRYQRYDHEEIAHLDKAMESYKAYANHIFFFEGDHETGLDDIAHAIERHIEETGNKPIVFVDYLQIIAPIDVHFTDKQNIDRIVTGLKKLSRTYELTIIAISSFNRENYNLEASMIAFKESGGIDYSADVLIGLQARGAGTRGFNLETEKKKDPRELELKILKNRTAALGDPLPMRFYPAFSYFEESK